MQYDCGDILFDFFFRGDYAITWSASSVDIRLDVESISEASNDLSLAVGANQSAGSDLRLAVASLIAVASDTVFDVKAISVSAVALNVIQSGWRNSSLSLTVSEQNAYGNHQMQLNLREEDWFTN